MLNFNLNEAPPTLAEIAKEWASLNWRWALVWSLFALVVLATFADAIPGLEPYKDFNYNLAISVVRFLPMIALAFQVPVITNNVKQSRDLQIISEVDCLDIAKGLDQPLIATYCARVATQGRKLVTGEYNAIVQQILGAQSNAACKKGMA